MQNNDKIIITRDCTLKTFDLEIEGQGHKTIVFMTLPIYTHIINLKGLNKIFKVIASERKSLRRRRDPTET